MARTRNLKPGFFRNDKLGEIGVEAAWLFEGMWCWCDCDGVIENRPLRLKADILPYWDWDVPALVSALEKSGFIRTYSARGFDCIHILNFKKHQNPHRNELPSELPRPDEAVSLCSVDVREKTGTLSDKQPSDPALSLLPTTLSLNPNTSNCDRETESENASAKNPPHDGMDRFRKPAFNPRECPPKFQPKPETVEKIRQHHPKLTDADLAEGLKQMKAHVFDQDVHDWNTKYQNWMNRYKPPKGTDRPPLYVPVGTLRAEYD